MAVTSILDRYGIKEVADVTFYNIEKDGTRGAPVLYLDTLKVSTIEQTADNTSARGGKGNPELIMWDFGKEITLNLEDALFSAKSMAVMFGDVDGAATQESHSLPRTWDIRGLTSAPTELECGAGKKHTVSASAKYYTATGSSSTEWSADAVYVTDDLAVKDYTEIQINPDTFPGTYYVTGDTFARSETTGEDEFFQFIIQKAKMLSEVTLTMEAEGDPSTFSMSLKVLRPKSGDMMKLVKYTL